VPIPRIPHPNLPSLPPVLRAGFRPFFFAGALWALVVVTLWVASLRGLLVLPTGIDALAWHRHEMLFGYLAAVIAGFLMTAIPNWTGRLPLAGAPLAALAGFWAVARLAILFSAAIPPVIGFAIDFAFLLTLVAVCAREVIPAKNRNMAVVAVVFAFTLASAADSLETLGLLRANGAAWRAGFSLVLILVALIGGRIIPSFTRNWLSKQGYREGLPTQPDGFDKGAIAVTAAALFAWAALPESRFAGVALMLAGLLQLGRLARWSGWRTAREPLVMILHVAFLWLPLGLLLLGSALLSPTIPATAGVHALGAGAMASMTLAVMTRATLGHTGRDLTASGLTVALYGLVTAGAAARVAAPFLPIDYMTTIALSAALWGGAFLLFLWCYGPKLLGPRPDGRP
jgi:uncharacterized protein involved in response to NO